MPVLVECWSVVIQRWRIDQGWAPFVRDCPKPVAKTMHFLRRAGYLVGCKFQMLLVVFSHGESRPLGRYFQLDDKPKYSHRQSEVDQTQSIDMGMSGRTGRRSLNRLSGQFPFDRRARFSRRVLQRPHWGRSLCWSNRAVAGRFRT
jgi:hypothetical protein